MIEYKEVVTKKHKRIVFCKLLDLLKDLYKESTLEGVQSHLTRGEYICHCPFCKEEGHRKHKLYIKEDFSQGNCFVCGRAYINIDDTLKVEFKLPDFYAYQQKFSVVPLTDKNGVWTIENYYNEFDDYSDRGLEYLRGRNMFMKDLWQPLGFKFLNDNIVMPFKYHDDVIYYQIRFIDATQKDSIRYFFPPMPYGTKPPYIIENGDNKKFIIVEGVYDAIAALVMAPTYTPFACLGSSITTYQLEFLREYMPEKILIYMDETKISNKIADSISQVINYCPIYIIPSKGSDPEEIMNYRIRKGLNPSWIGPDYGEDKKFRPLYKSLW